MGPCLLDRRIKILNPALRLCLSRADPLPGVGPRDGRKVFQTRSCKREVLVSRPNHIWFMSDGGVEHLLPCPTVGGRKEREASRPVDASRSF